MRAHTENIFMVPWKRAGWGKLVYYKHRVRPTLQMSSRTAWAIAFSAGQRRVLFQRVIEDAMEAWARAWEEQLGDTDRRRFVEGIPFHRGTDGRLEG